MIRRSLLIFVLATMTLACQTPPPAANSQRPSASLTPLGPEDWARVYPPAAEIQGLAGRAVVRCTSDAQGFMGNCELLEETPSGAGFGAAAIELSTGRRATRGRDGPPVVGGTFTMPYNFRLE